MRTIHIDIGFVGKEIGYYTPNMSMRQKVEDKILRMAVPLLILHHTDTNANTITSNNSY